MRWHVLPPHSRLQGEQGHRPVPVHQIYLANGVVILDNTTIQKLFDIVEKFTEKVRNVEEVVFKN